MKDNEYALQDHKKAIKHRKKTIQDHSNSIKLGHGHTWP